jgi:hypothetical protein
MFVSSLVHMALKMTQYGHPKCGGHKKPFLHHPTTIEYHVCVREREREREKAL